MKRLTLLLVLLAPAVCRAQTLLTSGPGAPSGACTDGIVMYFNNDSATSYDCQGGGWVVSSMRVVWRQSNGVPSNSLGKDGDYVVDTSANPQVLYQRVSGSYSAVALWVTQVAMNAKANASSLAAVATSGNYNDLSNKPTIPSLTCYNASGATGCPTKKWTATVSPSTASGYSIDISSAGFSSVTNVQIIAVRNTSTVTSSPNVSIKTISTSAIVVNVVEGNPTLVNILGSNVPLGLGQVFANTTGLSLVVMVEGN